MIRVFLDANVLFTAAHNPDGKAALVIELGVRGYWQLFTSDYALEEAGRNLKRKFPRSLATLEEMRPALRISSHHGAIPELTGLAGKDQPIFQAALACEATHLLTGDIRDFGRFMNRPADAHGIRIQIVASFLTDQTT